MRSSQQGAVAPGQIQFEAPDPEATVGESISGQSFFEPGPHGVLWILHCVSWHGEQNLKEEKSREVKKIKDSEIKEFL